MNAVINYLLEGVSLLFLPILTWRSRQINGGMTAVSSEAAGLSKNPAA
jgi:hypothetical protein